MMWVMVMLVSDCRSYFIFCEWTTDLYQCLCIAMVVIELANQTLPNLNTWFTCMLHVAGAWSDSQPNSIRDAHESLPYKRELWLCWPAMNWWWIVTLVSTWIVPRCILSRCHLCVSITHCLCFLSLSRRTEASGRSSRDYLFTSHVPPPVRALCIPLSMSQPHNRNHQQPQTNSVRQNSAGKDGRGKWESQSSDWVRPYVYKLLHYIYFICCGGDPAMMTAIGIVAGELCVYARARTSLSSSVWRINMSGWCCACWAPSMRCVACEFVWRRMVSGTYHNDRLHKVAVLGSLESAKQSNGWISPPAQCIVCTPRVAENRTAASCMTMTMSKCQIMRRRQCAMAQLKRHIYHAKCYSCDFLVSGS